MIADQKARQATAMYVSPYMYTYHVSVMLRNAIIVVSHAQSLAAKVCYVIYGTDHDSLQLNS